MNTGDRLFSTITTSVIWGAVCLMVIAMSENVDSAFGANLIWVMLVAVFAAAIATRAVWRDNNSAARRETLRDVIAEKAKKTRVQKLLNVLSDSELEELRARLGDSNGEISGDSLSLDELLTQQEQRNRR